MIIVVKLVAVVLCSAGLLISLNADAQTPAVSSTLTASVVSLVNGKTVKKPAVDAKPGDVIEYRAVYINNGKTQVERVLLSVPIPEGTTMVDKTVFPVGATASVDAVTFASMPLMRTIKSADGASRTEDVPLSEYRAIRWALNGISGGQQVAVSVNVRVNPTVAFAIPRTSVSTKP